MNLMGGLIQTKLHETLATLEKREVQQEVMATMKMAGLMTTQRSYSDYLTESKKALPDFFGFEGVGILLFDIKFNVLFTID